MSKPIRVKKPKIDYPNLLLNQLLETDLPLPVKEHKFHPVRKWRFDLAWKEHMLAVEVEGGIWTYGRHNRAASFIKDMEKYNEACLLGWNLLRFTTDMVKNGEAVNMLVRFFKNESS
tara:strand:- start:312 stop:662 length:351 start_codon:yes stop_codon:yes gene_type:complete